MKKCAKLCFCFCSGHKLLCQLYAVSCMIYCFTKVRFCLLVITKKFNLQLWEVFAFCSILQIFMCSWWEMSSEVLLQPFLWVLLNHGSYVNITRYVETSCGLKIVLVFNYWLIFWQLFAPVSAELEGCMVDEFIMWRNTWCGFKALWPSIKIKTLLGYFHMLSAIQQC